MVLVRQAALGRLGCNAVGEAVSAAAAAFPRWRRATLVDPDTLRGFARHLMGRLAKFGVEAMASVIHHVPLA